MPIRRHEFLLTLVILIATAIYAYNIRAGYIGTLSNGRHQWLSASTLKFTENWREYGFWNEHGLMLEYPKTIERPTIEERRPYLSYLPGAPLEIFLLMQLWPNTGILTLIHLFNIVNQYAIAGLLALMVWHGIPAAASGYRHAFAVLAALAYMLHPGTLYWHSLVFFSDQAVLLPFTLVLLLELFIRGATGHRQRRLLYAQSLLLFIGTCIDWFAVTAAMIVYLFRLISPLTPTLTYRYAARNLLQIFSGPLIAITLWGIQVYATGMMDTVLVNLSSRAALSNGFQPMGRFSHVFVEKFIYGHLAATDALMILIAFAYATFEYARDRKNPALCVTMIAFLSCFLHTYIFSQHAEKHEFSILKFYGPLAFAAYGLLPAFLLRHVHFRKPSTQNSSLLLLVMLWVVMACAITIPAHRNWQKGFPPPRLYHHALIQWIQAHARFETVLFSRDIQIVHAPPQALAITRHPVYRPATVALLDYYMQSIPAGAQFFGIIPANDAMYCGVDPTQVPKVWSERGYWLFVRLDAGSDIDLKRCLTRDGR